MGAMPYPETATDCGLEESFSFTTKVPSLGPKSVGENVTVMLQDELGASHRPQSFFWLKSPETLISPTAKGVTSTFVRVTIWELGTPTIWMGNSRDGVETTAAAPLPRRGIAWAFPPACADRPQDTNNIQKP